MLSKMLMTAGLTAAALGVALPAAASAQYYDSRPHTSFSVSIGSGYNSGYYGRPAGYGYYDHRDWRRERWEERRREERRRDEWRRHHHDDWRDRD